MASRSAEVRALPRLSRSPVGLSTLSSRSSGVISASSAITAARYTRFISSRTLPGQENALSALRALVLKARARVP